MISFPFPFFSLSFTDLIEARAVWTRLFSARPPHPIPRLIVHRVLPTYTTALLFMEINDVALLGPLNALISQILESNPCKEDGDK